MCSGLAFMFKRTVWEFIGHGFVRGGFVLCLNYRWYIFAASESSQSSKTLQSIRLSPHTLDLHCYGH